MVVPNASADSTPQLQSPKSYTLVGKIVLACSFIIFAFILFIFFFHFYLSRRLRLSAEDRRMQERRDLYLGNIRTRSNVPASNPGLDPAIVKSLPVFTPDKRSATDCPVCLSEFQENERGRMLPGCKHSFHVDCIDMWFRSHSSCPVCRSAVELEATGLSCDGRRRQEDKGETTRPPSLPSSSAALAASSSTSCLSSPPPPV